MRKFLLSFIFNPRLSSLYQHFQLAQAIFFLFLLIAATAIYNDVALT